jgi:hypothetical protein
VDRTDNTFTVQNVNGLVDRLRAASATFRSLASLPLHVLLSPRILRSLSRLINRELIKLFALL